ncbi:hypothetical protein OAK75_04785 [Bacteriovoracales bacterium]|nr:hypothetical protein [Bacteriovoracales bacterium]
MWSIFGGKAIIVVLVSLSLYLSGVLIYFFSKDFIGKKSRSRKTVSENYEEG